jgi:hypothetical protein
VFRRGRTRGDQVQRRTGCRGLQEGIAPLRTFVIAEKVLRTVSRAHSVG